MIRKIKFNNFYSFKTEQTLDFTARKKTSYSYYNSKFGDQISKITGFVGPNASGKTNIMRLLSFIGHFVSISGKNDAHPEFNIAYKNFFNNKQKSDFFIEFELENKLFTYEFSLKENKVIKEELQYKNLEKYSRVVLVFERDDSGIKYLNEDLFSGFNKKFLDNIRPDICSIAFFRSNYDLKIINLVYNYFLHLKTNIDERGNINNKRHQLTSLRLYLDDPEIKNEMNRVIKNFDVGISKFDIREKKEEDKLLIGASGFHDINEETIGLSLDYESRGTQSLFFNLARIIYAIKNNTGVILDEFEYGLHPEALNKLISYFLDESAGSTSQLFFASHSLSFMNSLEANQIFLVEKDKYCQSTLYSLNSVKGIRSDENFLAKYMSGAYGAFPKIRI